MKRHDILVPLSREHHEALILARLLQKKAPAYKGLPGQTGEKSVYATTLYTTKLQEHFRKEEQLLQKVKHYHSEIERLTAEIISEHNQLAAMFAALQDAKELAELLHKLGTLLEMHIRKEERVLFPLIQEHCPEEVLQTIEW